jgi:hypothetical protein
MHMFVEPAGVLHPDVTSRTEKRAQCQRAEDVPVAIDVIRALFDLFPTDDLYLAREVDQPRQGEKKNRQTVAENSVKRSQQQWNVVHQISRGEGSRGHFIVRSLCRDSTPAPVPIPFPIPTGSLNRANGWSLNRPHATAASNALGRALKDAPTNQ